MASQKELYDHYVEVAKHVDTPIVLYNIPARTGSMMFNLEPRHGQKSEFAGPYFECMKTPFLGANGHIAMRTPNLTTAVEEFKEKGFSFNMDTAAYTEEGDLKNVYLDGEFGGFAIHIMHK